jgi:hypothetical protein
MFSNTITLRYPHQYAGALASGFGMGSNRWLERVSRHADKPPVKRTENQHGQQWTMANALEQPLDGLLPQSEYEAQHAVPPAVGAVMRQGVFAKHAAARWHGGRDAYQQQLLKLLTARRIIKDGRRVKRWHVR